MGPDRDLIKVPKMVWLIRKKLLRIETSLEWIANGKASKVVSISLWCAHWHCIYSPCLSCNLETIFGFLLWLRIYDWVTCNWHGSFPTLFPSPCTSRSRSLHTWRLLVHPLLFLCHLSLLSMSFILGKIKLMIYLG